VKTQPYYQDSGAGTPHPPPALRWVLGVFAALVAVLIALPVLMSVDRDFVTTSILRSDPALDGERLQFAIGASLIFSWGLHLVYAAVGAWLVIKTLRGRQWARVGLTVLMVLATANSVDSAMKGPEYYGWVISGDILQLTIVALLWLPASTRAFFARHRELRQQGPHRTNKATA
jgi:hypothetical protein